MNNLQKLISFSFIGTNFYISWKFREQDKINRIVRERFQTKLDKPPNNSTISDFGKWYDKEFFPFENEEVRKHFHKNHRNEFISNWEKRESSKL